MSSTAYLMPGRSMVLPDLPASSIQWAIVQPRLPDSSLILARCTSPLLEVKKHS
jgi:hypothetical protein